MEVQFSYGNESSLRRNIKTIFGTDIYKIYDNIGNEYGNEKYLVCKEFKSPVSIAGKFNTLEDAELFCTIKNCAHSVQIHVGL